MRTDPKKQQAFVQSEQWNRFDLNMNTFRESDTDGEHKSVARSFSGHERNRLFIRNADNFDDVSLLSGLDSRNDSRGFAKFDFNRDGKLDVAVAGPLNPRLEIFRNDIPNGTVGQSVSLMLRGGATVAKSQTQWSNRDGIGAAVLVEMDGVRQLLQVSCGEGLASQNSRWLHIGLGESEEIDKLTIDWPSGKNTIHQSIKAGTRVIVHENGSTEAVQ